MFVWVGTDNDFLYNGISPDVQKLLMKKLKKQSPGYGYTRNVEQTLLRLLILDKLSYDPPQLRRLAACPLLVPAREARQRHHSGILGIDRRSTGVEGPSS